MSVFVTGGTGYIGQLLIQQLLQQSFCVQALIRQPSKVPFQHKNLIWYKGDITDYNSVIKAMQGCEQAYHIAALVTLWEKDHHQFDIVNVYGTKNVLDAAVQNGVQRIVITSTGSVFGPSIKFPITENDPRTLSFFYEYERSKYEAEKLARTYITKGLQPIMVNPTRVYGPGAATESNAVTKMIQLFMQDKWHFIPGDGETVANYAFVHDVVQGHIQAMQKGIAGECYLLGGENKSYNTFFNTLKQLTHSNKRLYKIPIGIIKNIAQFQLAMIALRLRKKPLFTTAFAKKQRYNWAISCEKAITQLGYNITAFEQGLQQTISSIKKQQLSRAI